MEPESANRPGGSADAERTVGNLRDQVRELESLLLVQQAQLAECGRLRSMFEEAANERLRVIHHGDRLLRSQAEEIQAMRAEVREREALAAGAVQERSRLESACRETVRSLAEVAVRERALNRELLELRNEGLIHSISRRLSRLFS